MLEARGVNCVLIFRLEPLCGSSPITSFFRSSWPPQIFHPPLMGWTRGRSRHRPRGAAHKCAFLRISSYPILSQIKILVNYFFACNLRAHPPFKKLVNYGPTHHTKRQFNYRLYSIRCCIYATPLFSFFLTLVSYGNFN